MIAQMFDMEICLLLYEFRVKILFQQTRELNKP